MVINLFSKSTVFYFFEIHSAVIFSMPFTRVLLLASFQQLNFISQVPVATFTFVFESINYDVITTLSKGTFSTEQVDL